jgi:deoxyribonuclease V
VAIALLDVDYRGDGACAACVLAASWTDAASTSQHAVGIAKVEAYEPGHFYRRELPCLLEVLASSRFAPGVVVVDGYVWLADESRPGLGWHLHQALASRIPVVGIAKTAFVGADASALVAKVFRGGSKRPLYVTAVGVDLRMASAWVEGMAGAHRIPSLVAAVDRLSRTAHPVLHNAPDRPEDST